MKKVFTVLLTLMFMLSMVATPAMAKGGGGGHGGGGKSGGKSSVSSSAKSNTGSGNVVNSTKGSKSHKNTYSTGLKVKNALSKANIASQSDYSDTTGHWASKAVKTMKALGIVNGYQDGTFQPDSPVTNTEAMVMMVKMAELVDTDVETEETTTTEEEVTDDTTVDEDTSDEETTEQTDTETDQVPTWAKESFKQAKGLKIINVNRFHSQVQADRAQAAVMLAKALNLQPVLNGELPFSDVGYLKGEDLGYLVALQQAGIIHGTPDGKFNPNSSITRAEIAAMMAQVVPPPTDTTTTDTTTTDTTTTDTTTTDTTTTDTTTDTTTTDTTTTDTTTTDTTTT